MDKWTAVMQDVGISRNREKGTCGPLDDLCNLSVSLKLF